MPKLPTELQKANRLRLVDALRSGQYKQRRGRLRDTFDNSFCVGGVACDVIDPTKWNGDMYDGFATILPPSIGRAYGFNLGDNLLLGEGYDDENSAAPDLMYLNDTKQLSFRELADVIVKSCAGA